MIVRVKLFPETEMNTETLGDEKELSPGGKTRDKFFPKECYSTCFGSVARSKTIKTRLIPRSLVSIGSIIHIQFANHEKKYSQYAQSHELHSFLRFMLCIVEPNNLYICIEVKQIYFTNVYVMINAILCVNRIDVPNDCNYRD